MSWHSHYVPPQMTLWQGRDDAPPHAYYFQYAKPLDLQHIQQSDMQGFALIGFSCDSGIRRNKGRAGAAEGPSMIRKVLASLSVHHQNLILYDAGDIICTDDDLENAQLALAEAISILHQHQLVPIVLGGGHELAFGHYQGLQKIYPHEVIGMINFDAHFDMRPLLPAQKGSSGTPFLQIAERCKANNLPFHYYCFGIQHASNTRELFETAKQYNVKFVTATEFYENNMDQINQLIDDALSSNQHLYLSLCLDVFAQNVAPGVSAPQAFGLTPWQVLPMIRTFASSGKILSYDIAELSPRYDIDNRTAKLAAGFVAEIIQHHVQG